MNLEGRRARTGPFYAEKLAQVSPVTVRQRRRGDRLSGPKLSRVPVSAQVQLVTSAWSLPRAAGILARACGAWAMEGNRKISVTDLANGTYGDTGFADYRGDYGI
jgi:hypothetical protein